MEEVEERETGYLRISRKFRVEFVAYERLHKQGEREPEETEVWTCVCVP